MLFPVRLIAFHYKDLIRIIHPTNEYDQVDISWVNERDLTLPPELVGRVEISFPELLQAIHLEATPVKIALFTYGLGKLLNSITQVLEDLGGKSSEF